MTTVLEPDPATASAERLCGTCGNANLEVARFCDACGAALDKRTHITRRLGPEPLVIGRDPDCDLAIVHPKISWHHARLTAAAGTVTLEDLGSSNGTFHNGHRITDITTVAVGDVIALGSASFKLRSPTELKQYDDADHLDVEVENLVVDFPGKRLLEGVSVAIRGGELVGLMGPSGAGKTTLMLAMNGYNPPAGGRVLFGGRDLYTHYDLFRLHIGYVPQDDIMHGDLTVKEALFYCARLRLPSDTRTEEIEARIAEVLEQLGLQGTEDVLIGSASKKGISGGQRKRVNLAMELLTDPAVLFLDEPTSGLSSEDALTVMKVPRELADRGKTVLLTIHQPSRDVFRLMDHLLLLAKDAGSPKPASTAYYGPAYPDSIRYFAPEEQAVAEPSPDRLLEGLARRPAAGEIVAEWPIYHRERMINLHLLPYVGSKAALLGLVSLLQCGALLGIVHRGCGLRGPWLPMLALLLLTSLVGMALGLLISARERTSEVAISLVPLILLPMVILGGIMQPPHEMGPVGEPVTGLLASPWAFETLLTLESNERPELRLPPVPGQDGPATRDVAEPYFHAENRSPRAMTHGALLAMLALALGGTGTILKSRDVHRRARRSES